MVLKAEEPPPGLVLLSHTLLAGTTMVRVCTDALGTTEPSTADTGRRFSPVRTAGGNVPVLYAGQDLGCALAETVFHDLEDDPAVPQEILRSDLLTLRAGTLRLRRDVVVGDLRDAALTSYGLARVQVTAAATVDYPVTRYWCQRVWDTGRLDGIVWNSRRSRERLSYLLFLPTGGQRGVRRRHDVEAAAPPVLLFDGPGLGAVMTAASARNVTVVIP